jgi:hypothetical protein
VLPVPSHRVAPALGSAIGAALPANASITSSVNRASERRACSGGKLFQANAAITSVQPLFDATIAEAEPVVEPDAVANHLNRQAVGFVAMADRCVRAAIMSLCPGAV